MDPLLIVAVLAVTLAALALYAFRLAGQLRAAETKLAGADERASQVDLLRMQLGEVARERDGALQDAAALRPLADRCPRLEDELVALRSEKEALAAAKAAYERGEAERADAFQRFLRAAAPFHDWGAAQTFARLLLVDRGAPWLEGYARALDAAAAQGQGLHDVVRRLSALLAAPEPPATNAALMAAL